MALVFIHRGYSPYLEFTLRQARAASPDSDILLLGDPANAHLPGLRHIDLTTRHYAHAGAAVAEVYRHRSTNSRSFEIGCFARWFMLAAVMRYENINDAIVLDSDVMIYGSEGQIRENWLLGAEVGLCVPEDQAEYRWIASPHVSFWTRESLEAFCGFVLNSFRSQSDTDTLYESKWRHHLHHNLFGGVVDMTALYLFWQTLTSAPRTNFLHIKDRLSFDMNMNGAENLFRDEYEMQGQIKAIRWHNGLPVGSNLRTGQPVGFQALHFQGKAKEFVPAYYRGPSFAGQTGAGLRLTGEYKVRRLAAAVLQPARLAAAKFSSGPS